MQIPLAGVSVILLLDLGQRLQDDRVVKLYETLRSHSPFPDGHLQKRLPRCAGQCLYRCSSVAQLNECGKPAACGAATYSVIGRQLAGQALNNTSSHWTKQRPQRGFTGLSYQKRAVAATPA
ncbi:hypothetical protein PchlR47_14060 [Pseudomonas chlororaphis]|nr:hypothetical protein PchlR47_14060 [Pseudomonas chlororaphis]